MPTQLIIERIPIPSLQKYVLFSLVGLASAMLFAWSHAEDYMMEVFNVTENISDTEKDKLFRSLTMTEYNDCLISAITSQIWTVWVMINMCYCLMALLAKVIQLSVFGALRVGEVQQLKERFWNFAFYKFIFIFGVLNVQFMNDAFMWTAWFSVICALQLFAQLSKFRFEYLSCSPATPKSQHMKLIFLLILILLLSFCLVAGAILTGFYTDWNIFGFMVAECLLLIVRTVYVIMKYTIYLVDINHDGLWETRGTLAYYTDLVCELLVLFIDLLHYIHMVIWSNIFLSMASIVIWMQVRFLFNELQKRVSRHRNYLNVVKSMEARFRVATDQELEEYDDNCAICWDKMQVARKLPCGHLFHNSCLRSWLAQDISCPTCRVSLSEVKPEDQTEEGTEDGAVAPPNNMESGDGHAIRHRASDRAIRPDARRMNRTTNLFHFDASRYISWLPSFSVEVTHMQLNNAQTEPQEPTQLDNMAQEVQTVFPSIDLRSIIEDLQNTHSVEITINNILEGRLTILGNTNASQEDASSSIDDEDSDNDSDTNSSGPSLFENSTSSELDSESGPQEPANIMTCAPNIPTRPSDVNFPGDASSRHKLLEDRKSELLARTRHRYFGGEDTSASKSTSSTSKQTPESSDAKTKKTE